MLKFWNAPYPFNDFILCSYKNGDKNNRDFDLAKSKLGQTGIKNTKHYQMGETNCILATTYASDDSREDSFISGVAQYNGKFIFGQDDLQDCNNEELRHSTGIFTSINIERNRVVVSQDVFGCGISFYAILDDCFVISNRYHLLLLFLSWIGFKGKLDTTKVIASLYSNTTFLGQNISEEMDIKGTFQLSFDKEVIIDEDGWKVVSKREISNGFDGLCEKDLIDHSRQELINNVRAVLDSGKFNKYVIDLSGGFDSRVVLAAALNIPGAEDIFEIYTKDVPGSSDLNIAAGIKDYYGLKYYQDPGRAQLPLTIEENLHIWRSYFMGTYYRMGFSAWSPQGTNTSQVRMSGGCGELYRTFWHKIYSAKVKDAKSLPDMAFLLVNSFHRFGKQDEEVKNRLIELIIDSLNKVPGESPVHKLDNHYLYFRNRYHFGLRAFEYFHDSPMWFPLMSRSLFTASKQLTLDEKTNNNLMLDMTHALKPTLVRFDYDSVPFESNSYLPKLIGRDKGIKINSNLDDWKEIDERNKELIMSNRSEMSADFYNSWKHSNLIIKSKLFSNFEKLRDTTGELEMWFDATMLESIENNLNNQGFMNAMYAKMSSLNDQFDIFN